MKVLKSDGAISFCIAKSAPVGGRDSSRSEDMVKETLKEEKENGGIKA